MSESSRKQDFSIRLDRERVDGVIHGRREICVEGTIGPETSQVRASNAVNHREIAAGYNHSVGLNGHSAHGIIWACSRIEPEIEIPIGVESGEIHAVRAIDR